MTRSILHHIGRKLNLTKVERYRIAILRIGRLHRCGRHFAAIALRHRRAIKRGDGEVEGIAVKPVAALQDLVQLSICRIERNILSAVLVGEGNYVGFLVIDLGGCRQHAVAVIGNIDGHNMVCPVVVQACSLNVPKP